MGVAKVIELLADGDTIESAVKNGVAEARKTLRSIRGVWIDGTQALLDDSGDVVAFRVNLKVTFVVE
ncbi:MAG: dodecin domain-containing protein [Ignavibacteriae bacterium]|nr:dodecin domain-containing protein [Ignavibacteriota bacterium]MCB9217444.1 dodecin domain-containing protein [Ignavibacteria bacterium]